jgi:hypothetical protein
MFMMSTTSERLFDAIQTLPEPLLTEVLDFADFLRAKQMKSLSESSDTPLTSLCGGLENTKTFSASPLAIQEQLRDEWR